MKFRHHLTTLAVLSAVAASAVAKSEDRPTWVVTASNSATSNQLLVYSTSNHLVQAIATGGKRVGVCRVIADINPTRARERADSLGLGHRGSHHIQISARADDEWVAVRERIPGCIPLVGQHIHGTCDDGGPRPIRPPTPEQVATKGDAATASDRQVRILCNAGLRIPADNPFGRAECQRSIVDAIAVSGQDHHPAGYVQGLAAQIDAVTIFVVAAVICREDPQRVDCFVGRQHFVGDDVDVVGCGGGGDRVALIGGHDHPIGGIISGRLRIGIRGISHTAHHDPICQCRGASESDRVGRTKRSSKDQAVLPGLRVNEAKVMPAP